MSMDLKLLCAAASRLAMYEYESQPFVFSCKQGSNV